MGTYRTDFSSRDTVDWAGCCCYCCCSVQPVGWAAVAGPPVAAGGARAPEEAAGCCTSCVAGLAAEAVRIARSERGVGAAPYGAAGAPDGQADGDSSPFPVDFQARQCHCPRPLAVCTKHRLRVFGGHSLGSYDHLRRHRRLRPWSLANRLGSPYFGSNQPPEYPSYHKVETLGMAYLEVVVQPLVGHHSDEVVYPAEGPLDRRLWDPRFLAVQRLPHNGVVGADVPPTLLLRSLDLACMSWQSKNSLSLCYTLSLVTLRPTH